MQIRTDLAIEAKEMYYENAADNSDINGVRVETIDKEDVTITRVIIENDNGVKELNKPIGNYITIESCNILNREAERQEFLVEILAEQIRTLVNLDEKDTVLVVGLGNWNITPDALGPKVASNIMVTRHLFQHAPQLLDDHLRPVCAISPGVLGITGVETSEIIKGIVEKINPKLIIAIDALASRRVNRVSTTIQIADTGINPGSGVGNNRLGLSKETLGVDVVAIGVPTVVDAVSIASDTFDKLIETISKDLKNGTEFLKNASKNLKKETITELLPEKRNYMVTPKDVDQIIVYLSKVIANGINLALHKNIDIKYAESFIS